MGKVYILPTLNVRRGTVCVLGECATGFEVAHESASGDSWGSFSGPYRTGQEAIDAARKLNRDVYADECAVFICDPARRDAGIGGAR